MKNKIKLAINWAGACGGCDVAVLDIEEKILDVAAMANIVYWPVAMDFKREDLSAADDQSIDVCLFNGMIRNSEHKEDALILRKKCKVMIAFGSCACFGGIPGLANVTDRAGVFETAYKTTQTTVNDTDTYPQPSTMTDQGDALTLPKMFDAVYALNQVVDVDYYVPGCPPTTDLILKAVRVIADYAEGGPLPPRGSVIAGEKALCTECKRIATKKSDRIQRIVRPHEMVIDPDICLLEQGIICMGPFTRAGCGAICVNANMPCRGCFGPTGAQLDPGAEALSALGSVTGPENEDYVLKADMLRPVNDIQDPVGTFYRFALPTAIISRTVKPKK
ncbi:F420-non-reducing hydrogenase subunit G [Desulfatiferula olefinivorans]